MSAVLRARRGAIRRRYNVASSVVRSKNAAAKVGLSGAKIAASEMRLCHHSSLQPMKDRNRIVMKLSRSMRSFVRSCRR